MNIYALENHQVIITNETLLRNGSLSDREKVKKYLEVDKIYRVDYTEIEGFSSRVYLQEFPGIAFNTVMFVDVSRQNPDDDKKHPEWNWYN